MDRALIDPKDVLCIYHGNCADGFGAACVVRLFYGSEATFHAATYGEAPPDVTGKHVVIVDFSYPYSVLSDMGWKAQSITVLDHHKTAAADLARFAKFETGAPDDGDFNTHWKMAMLDARTQGAPLIATCFDMERSGARLAWDHFYTGVEPPQLLQHIEDRDLWRFALEGTREVQAALFSFPYDFDIWMALLFGSTEDHEAVCQRLRQDGIAIDRKHHKDVAELVTVCQRRMVIGGYDVPVASLPYTLTSDAGERMAEGEPFAACYWDTPENRSFSLRSRDGGLDVSEIARAYGGGGHRNAAGFRVPRDHELARA